MKRLHVTSDKFAYDVVVGRGAWRALRDYSLDQHSGVFVLTERPLWKRWGRGFARDAGLRKAEALFMPRGETSKSMVMVERLALELLKQNADRHALLIAFGGGVVGDVGGFLASTYMRGIGLIQAPTTVVAQTDSAIGGKTAVNAGAMKNLIGTFYPPRLVLADPIVLTSMSVRAFRSGLYEIVKHAILSGGSLFEKLEEHMDKLRLGGEVALREGCFEPILAESTQVKVNVVSRDEHEAQLRFVLNLGHTFGHAFEAATDYARFMHGEAVAWGLLAVTRLAADLNILSTGEAHRIAALVRRVGPLPFISDLKPARVLSVLSHDKKSIGGRIHWVLPERIGKVRIVPDVPMDAAAAALKVVMHDES
jgi:3-dehydroquinate synthase